MFTVIAEYNRQKDLEDQKENSQQEILTLQQLLQETCDEATLANNEITRLSDVNERQRHEMMLLRETLLQQQQVCKANNKFASVFNSFISLKESSKSLESILGLKTLARNVKKITGTNSNSQESLDDNMRKVATTAPSSKYVIHHPLIHLLHSLTHLSLLVINLFRFRLRKMPTLFDL